MKKVYIDLAIVAICAFIAIKYTVFFVIIAAIFVSIWLWGISDTKKKEFQDKISSFYNR